MKKVTLGNGLQVVLKEMHHAPVASFWIWYRVGSRNEVPGITGISHWVEHMLFKGTPSFPQGEFDKVVAREGGVFNGMTWLDWTTYFETLPSDRFDLALRIEADRMVNSLFDAQELEKERTVVISEREGAENFPEWLLEEEVQAAAYRLHPYRHQVLGWKQDLQHMTRDDLWQYYRAYYAPNNAIAVATGDFQSDALLARIEELFGAIPPGPELPVVRASEPPQRGERRVVVEGEGQTAYLQMVFHAVPATHPDYFPLVVLDTVLGGAKPMSFFGGGTSNRSSRLYKALVDTELAADVDSSMPSTLDPFLFSFSATLRPGRTLEEVEAALWAELERVAQEPITPEELAKAIKQTRAQFAYSSESVSNQGFWLGFSEIVASTEWFDSYLDNLAAVTAEDVQRVAKEYLAKSRRTVGWYVPQG
ncbi:MAG: pitrilysin family protein [Anaerolineae bacterium]|nr:pitrilysin family protein [Anaerolineae bacterium]